MTEPQPVKHVAPGIIEVNSSTLIIGPTGSGKSALLATAYEYVWETYKMISLHYNSDPGGFPDKLRALMAHGIVRVWRMQSRGMDYSFETANLASRGWWPAQIDPKSGMSPYGVRMIPPVVTTYIEFCGNCNQEAGRSIVEQTLKRGQCPHCKQVRSPITSRIEKLQSVSRGFENIGTRGYDGLTSISDWYLQDMSHRKELGGEEGALGGKINSGDLVWRQNNRAQVGFAQSRAHELVTNALEIPGMVVQPLWTAMASETTDSGGLYVVGAKLAGQAKTDEASGWFGNTFEAAVIENAQGRKQRRLYTSEFIDEQRRRHLLKHRADARLVQEYYEDDPYDERGQPPAETFTNFNLGVVFRALDSSLERTIAEVGMRYPDAPGLDSVPSTYGMDVDLNVPVPSTPQPTVTGRPVARPRGAPRPRGAQVPPSPAASSQPAPVPVPEPATTPVAAAEVTAPAVEAPAAAQAPTPPASPVVPAPAPPSVAAAPAPSAAAAPGAWAPPPGAPAAGPPRAPGRAPAARPIARPRSTK